jgi:hypothetical protein
VPKWHTTNKIDVRHFGGHQSTAEAVAKETGVSPRTIANDIAYAEAGKRNMAVIGGAKNQLLKMSN